MDENAKKDAPPVLAKRMNRPSCSCRRCLTPPAKRLRRFAVLLPAELIDLIRARAARDNLAPGAWAAGVLAAALALLPALPPRPATKAPGKATNPGPGP